MTSPGVRLDSVVSALAGTLLEVLAGTVDGTTLITDVVVDDPREQAPVRAGAMLLCTAADVRDLPALLDRVVTRQVPALVVRAPLDIEPELRARIEHSGVALLGLAGGATWAQLVVLLRSLLSSSERGETLLAGMPAEDSFALANAIGSLLDAPITIEDRDSQILAFSDRQNEADQTRIDTILGRVVPQQARLAQQRAGVFKQLYASEKPIFIDTPLIEGVPGLPRMAIAVRAGDQVLGSIWAAVPGPLSDEKEQVLVDAAKVVALQLLRHRIGVDVDRQVRTDLLATALTGAPPASGAIERLGLTHRAVTVLGLSLPNGNSADTAASGQARRQTLERITDSFAFHLSVAAPGAVAAVVGDVCYAIVPTPIRKGKESVTAMAQRIANDYLDRTRDRFGRVEIGIGREVSSSDPAGLARSRHDADRTLRVLRQEPAGRVAVFADVQLNALLLEIGDQLRNQGGLLDGPIARLHHHDREHGTTMAETVAQWLDHLGNTLNAAAAMDVHPNTFRYRLRRAAEIAQLNLNDPDERFAAMLEFRLTRQRPSKESG